MANAKTEKGVMVMLNGLAFGIEYEDGHSTSYGWIDPCTAPIHDPQYCKKPSDVAGRPHDQREANKGKLVAVIRTTTVKEAP